MSRLKTALLTAGVLAVGTGFVMVLGAGFGRDTRAVPFMMKGKPAPGFTLRKVGGGGEVSLAALAGKPVVVNFWASWCGPCRIEHPVLEWGQSRFGDQVQFLGVVFEDTEENAQGFLARHGASFPQLLDPTSSMAVDYGAAGVPETYFISPDGQIVDRHVGPLSKAELSARIAALSQPVVQAGASR